MYVCTCDLFHHLSYITSTPQALQLEGITAAAPTAHNDTSISSSSSFIDALAAGLAQRGGQANTRRLRLLALGGNALPAAGWRRLLGAVGIRDALEEDGGE